MSRRPLAAVIGDLATAGGLDSAPRPGLRVTQLGIDVPIEVALELEHGKLIFIADLPRWRWRSDFDREPGRLALSLEAVAP
ncbi:MAG TPA: hypothetical protein VG500_06175 [Gemmatimonadales bacterium]|jgi:hypothetical protein|nr:hypothetical protein [Gemmatimonadales bacterium]